MADAGSESRPPSAPTSANLRQRHQHTEPVPTSSPPLPPSAPPAPQSQNATHQQTQPSFRAKAVAGAMGLGIFTAAVGGTYLLADNDAVFPIAVAACFATFSSVLVRFAFFAIKGVANGRPRVRHIRHHRHFTGERAAYVRTSQRLAMIERDFTAADYEMLLDLDNNSQRLRRFLEGASHETVSRLPTFIYRGPSKQVSDDTKTDGGRTAPSSAIDMAAAGDVAPDPTSYNSICESARAIAVPEQSGVPSRGDGNVQDITTHESEFAGATAKRCTICLEDFADGMKIRILPCFHRFMADCIDPWLVQQARCPVCKVGVQVAMDPEPAGMSETYK